MQILAAAVSRGCCVLAQGLAAPLFLHVSSATWSLGGVALKGIEIAPMDETYTLRSLTEPHGNS